MKEQKTTATAIDLSLRPSGFAPAFGRAVDRLRGWPGRGAEAPLYLEATASALWLDGGLHPTFRKGRDGWDASGLVAGGGDGQLLGQPQVPSTSSGQALRLRRSQRARTTSLRMTVFWGDSGRQARARVDPPFGFAQGRLCGDDNQNSNCNGKGGAVLVRKIRRVGIG
jgi:hypothetical protein